MALALTRPGDDVPVGNVELGCFDDEGLSAALGVSMLPAARDAEPATAAARRGVALTPVA